ncbi:MAG: hypothetical protein IIC91_02700 [Chloroflexi bacterium]|nr:hypothetical protein [Chloroflexota bacterium]MCH8007753.1 hypothetical protein [Chloroflexota bacterium]
MAGSIGTLNESHLHASLKEHYAQPGDLMEEVVDGYVVDILRDGLIIEIQTANFASINKKMRELVKRHQVRLVFPVAQDKWIVKLPETEGGKAGRRKSPKHGSFEDVFTELVSFPDLITHKNFELEVALTQEEEIRRFDRRRRWWRGNWVTVERRLLGVIGQLTVRSGSDLMGLLPPDLPDEFRTSDLADLFGRPRAIAQQAAYCLRKCGLIKQVGKEGNAIVYTKV